MVATIITAPQPTPSRHGLIDSAFPAPVAPGDSRWENGFGFVPEACAEPESWVIPCVGPGSPAGPGATLTPARGPLDDGFLSWRPYQIRASFKCDAQQLQSIDFEARARRIFEQGESKLMESELYRGDAAGYQASVTNPAAVPHNLTLTRGAVDLSGGAGPTAPSLAIRILIQAAANAPGAPRAMIHATPMVALAWVQGGSVVEGRDGRLVTVVGGHTVIAGTGYTGEGPDNVAPLPSDLTHWAWVTTPVYWVRSDEVQVLRAVAQADSDAEVIVQRTACAYWDGCLHAGVPVDAMGVTI